MANKENAPTLSAIEVKRLHEELRKAQQNARRLLNENQSLKGNIRTFVRVRPILACDAVKETDILPMSIQTDEMLAIEVPQQSASNAKTTRTANFKFNRVFGMGTSQHDIFQEMKEVVKSTLEGHNVSIISYGQTGSGKTYTMQGEGNAAGAGLIPRSLNGILTDTAKLKKKGWEFTIDLTFLEIYNETIKDLLRDCSLSKEKLQKTATDSLGGHKIVCGKERGVYVTNLNHIQIGDLSETHKVLAHAQRKRSVGKTKLNDKSSRSHSIFSLTVHGVNRKAQKEVRGTLHLCDLAGSERVRKSKVAGMAMKEAQAINKSLSQLSTVMQSIKRKEKHVPFRDSKLTRLLQECLNNSGKTIFMINVSPAVTSLQETHNSLVFARTVSQCELGKAEACVRRFAVAEARQKESQRKAKADALQAQPSPTARRNAKPPMTPASARMVKRKLFTPTQALQQQLKDQKTLTEKKVMAARESVVSEMQTIVQKNVSEAQRRHDEELTNLKRMHSQQIARLEKRYIDMKARMTKQLRMKQAQNDELMLELDELREDSDEYEEDCE